MEYFWNGAVFILGAIIGSFLNVVLYRLHTGKSLNGRSHCMTCQKTLNWYELFPIFSYIALRGRCRTCEAYIPTRYLFVELLTAFSFLAVWQVYSGDLIMVGLFLVLVCVCILIAVYDVRHTIIPDELVIIVGVVALTLVGYEYMQLHDLYLITMRCVAGFGAGLFFYGLWYISKGKWIGLGDAKLALPLGVVVGLNGVFSMVVLSFWIGAGVSVVLLGLERLLKGGKPSLHFLPTPLTIRSEVPFAPFLITGFLLVQLYHADIFTLTHTLFFSPY